MRWWFAGIVMLAGTEPGLAAEVVPGPACAEPAVLARVAEALQRAGQVAVIEAGSVGQAPGADADVVRCALRVRSWVYDTGRFGSVPQEVVRVVQYSLDRRRNGVFLKLGS